MSVTAQDGMGLDKEAPSKEDSTHAEALARETIISRASHVRSLLTGSLDLLSSHQNSLRYVEGHDLLSRLNMWAGHTGVFAEFHISLDYRLRDIPDLKELILAHLRTMRLRLEQRKADSWSRGWTCSMLHFT
ncbi:hypothetical protein SCUCBS95973_002385 [Sporothrix curviconia]|uniref:Uncharacterized protein n=1 Tax=Sporothrix curviconia TaxID=1260050 RepID=A0ABP0B6E0_9PEZI